MRSQMCTQQVSRPYSGYAVPQHQFGLNYGNITNLQDASTRRVSSSLSSPGPTPTQHQSPAVRSAPASPAPGRCQPPNGSNLRFANNSASQSPVNAHAQPGTALRTNFVHTGPTNDRFCAEDSESHTPPSLPPRRHPPPPPPRSGSGLRQPQRCLTGASRSDQVPQPQQQYHYAGLPAPSMPPPTTVSPHLPVCMDGAIGPSGQLGNTRPPMMMPMQQQTADTYHQHYTPLPAVSSPQIRPLLRQPMSTPPLPHHQAPPPTTVVTVSSYLPRSNTIGYPIQYSQPSPLPRYAQPYTGGSRLGSVRPAEQYSKNTKVTAIRAPCPQPQEASRPKPPTGIPVGDSSNPCKPPLNPAFPDHALAEVPLGNFVKSADPDTTDSLLRLLFARFVSQTSERDAARPGEQLRSAADPFPGLGAYRPSSSELRQIIGHLVRIAHTDVIIPSSSEETGSTGLLMANVASKTPCVDGQPSMVFGAGLMEKMDSLAYSKQPQPASSPRSRARASLPTTRTSADSDDANSSSDASEDFEDYEEDRTQSCGIRLSQAVSRPGDPAGPHPQMGYTNQSTGKPFAILPDSDIAILTAAELHALPRNVSVKNLKASAMQALINLVSAYQLDPALRQRDLGISQLLAHIQAYTSFQSERLSKCWEARRCAQEAAAAAAAAAAAGQSKSGGTGGPPVGSITASLDSPDDGRRVVAMHVPVAEVAALVRLSFHAEHRQAICDLGGLHALLSLLRWEHAVWQEHMGLSDRLASVSQVHSTTPPSAGSHHRSFEDCHLNSRRNGDVDDRACMADAEEEDDDDDGGCDDNALSTSLALRRYICMALTNLTFGVSANKAFVCRRRYHLEALLAQLEVGNEELKQVAASVLRNLSWHTDSRSMIALRKVQAAHRLTLAVLSAKREPTLRTTLSALWNLSSHCTTNKKAVCSVDGALAFLVNALDVGNQSKGLAVMESSGGILRNLCSVIVTSLEYRAVLRSHNCAAILLEQLRTSPSLTVVVNVCGVLGALSSMPPCDVKLGGTLLLESAATDHTLLIRLGALDILRRLSQSRHQLVVNSSKLALENLGRAQMLASQRLAKQQQVGGTRPCGGPMDQYDQSTAAAANLPTTFTSSTTSSSSSCSTSSGSPSVSSSPGSSSPSSPAELVYRRRMSTRSHLRFGLLSVVLETDDDYEEESDEDASDDDCSRMEGIGCAEKLTDGTDTTGDAGDGDGGVPSTPSASRIYTNSASGCGEAEEHDSDGSRFKLPAYPLEDPIDKVAASSSTYADGQMGVCLEDQDEEQACVYAEEGTPFGPSARASILDLRTSNMGPVTAFPETGISPDSFSVHEVQQPQSQTQQSPLYDNFMPSQKPRSENPYVNVAAASVCFDGPHVYTVGATPSEPATHQPKTIDDSLQSIQDDLSDLHLNTDSSATSRLPVQPADSRQLPVVKSPVFQEALGKYSRLASSNTTGVASPNYEGTGSNVLQTPLMFSRTSSSCILSVDLEMLPVIESSPESVYSDSINSRNMEEEDIALGTSPSSLPTALVEPPAPLDQADPEEKEEETRIMFAEEGSPLDGNSLNGEHHQQRHPRQPLPSSSCASASFAPYHAPLWSATAANTNGAGKYDALSAAASDGWLSSKGQFVRDDLDDGDEDAISTGGQSNILQQCIASVMPASRGAMSCTASLAPTMDMACDAPAHVVPPVVYGETFVSTEDTLQSFALEGTPFAFSTKTSSFSDVSISEADSSDQALVNTSPNLSKPNSQQSSVQEIPSLGQFKDTSPKCQSATTVYASDASSVNEEGSCDLLSEVIQSALPKQVCCPQSAGHHPNMLHHNLDTLQHFAVEGTPSRIDQLSSATSTGTTDEEECLGIGVVACGGALVVQTGLSVDPDYHSSPNSDLSSGSGALGAGGVAGAGVCAPPPPQRTTSVLRGIQGMVYGPVDSLVPQHNIAIDHHAEAEFIATKHEDGSSALGRSSPLQEAEGHTEPEDTSSFSSLLSIESAGVETSLLQECISSAMPTPKLPSGLPRPLANGSLSNPSAPMPTSAAAVPPAAVATLNPPTGFLRRPVVTMIATAPITSPASTSAQSSVRVLSPAASASELSTATACGLTPPQRRPSGIRRAGHFLVHGSGAADGSRPADPTDEKRTQQQLQHQSAPPPPLPPDRCNSGIGSLTSDDGSPVPDVQPAFSASNGDQVLKLPPPEPSEEITYDAEDNFPLPLPPAVLDDCEDLVGSDDEADVITLIGDTSPPEPPSEVSFEGSAPLPAAAAVITASSLQNEQEKEQSSEHGSPLQGFSEFDDVTEGLLDLDRLVSDHEFGLYSAEDEENEGGDEMAPEPVVRTQSPSREPVLPFISPLQVDTGAVPPMSAPTSHSDSSGDNTPPRSMLLRPSNICRPGSALRSVSTSNNSSAVQSPGSSDLGNSLSRITASSLSLSGASESGSSTPVSSVASVPQSKVCGSLLRQPHSRSALRTPDILLKSSPLQRANSASASRLSSGGASGPVSNLIPPTVASPVLSRLGHASSSQSVNTGLSTRPRPSTALSAPRAPTQATSSRSSRPHSAASALPFAKRTPVVAAQKTAVGLRPTAKKAPTPTDGRSGVAANVSSRPTMLATVGSKSHAGSSRPVAIRPHAKAVQSLDDAAADVGSQEVGEAVDHNEHKVIRGGRKSLLGRRPGTTGAIPATPSSLVRPASASPAPAKARSAPLSRPQSGLAKPATAPATARRPNGTIPTSAASANHHEETATPTPASESSSGSLKFSGLKPPSVGSQLPKPPLRVPIAGVSAPSAATPSQTGPRVSGVVRGSNPEPLKTGLSRIHPPSVAATAAGADNVGASARVAASKFDQWIVRRELTN
uniref:Adenomatous polyposis coli protein n=1 Tax=Schistocephalus solidus TaxID=70667 RepID=A0A0V0J546_SCHSO